MKEWCADCYGTGRIKCQACGGTGFWREASLLDEECPKCRGTGSEVHQHCRGTGFIEVAAVPLQFPETQPARPGQGMEEPLSVAA